jgi:hypothetical protein
MKMSKLFLAAVVIAAIALAGCASGGGGGGANREPPPPIPEGAERLLLENGAYAIFRFDLPAGTTWSDYNKLTAEYMVDEANIRKRIRNDNNVRLMGNYREGDFPAIGRERYINLGEAANNGPYIMDNAQRTWASMGAVPNEWFTVEYNITGSQGHSQFVRENVPAANAAGPFFLGVGLTGHDSGRFGGITQFIRNVTLHHNSNPALNVVSQGSGFEEPTFASFFPVLSRRESPAAE